MSKTDAAAPRHTEEQIVRHDFTPSACRWGWNLLHYTAAEGQKSAKVMAVGRGVENGHLIDLEFPYGRRSMRVGEIKYNTNPTDLFECNLYPVPNASGQTPPASGGSLDRLVGNSGVGHD